MKTLLETILDEAAREELYEIDINAIVRNDSEYEFADSKSGTYHRSLLRNGIEL